MKKIVFFILAAVIILSSCTANTQNITFTALIDSINDNGITVTTTDDVGFDKASVSYDKGYKSDFTPEVGQIVEVEILPEIRESYPVQVTAVNIKLKEDNKMAEYKKITPKEAKEIMDNEADAIILDVRTKEEFDEIHIKNAVLLTDTEIEEKAESVLPDKDAKILVYCRSGRRSEAASRKLIEMGYTDISDFGGIIDWKYEVVKE